MFQITQDDEYLAVCVHRARHEYLDWVEQFLDLIEQHASGAATLNDIGCNVGQFWKGLARRDLALEYRGYDIEPIYLEEARKIFPELDGRLSILDVTRKTPPAADVSVASATLEHLEHLSPGLEHMLAATRDLALVRTFLGAEPATALFQKPGAQAPYFVNQYSFEDLLGTFDGCGFGTTVVRDRHTDSMPKYLGPGIVRSQYVVVGKRCA